MKKLVAICLTVLMITALLPITAGAAAIVDTLTLTLAGGGEPTLGVDYTLTAGVPSGRILTLLTNRHFVLSGTGTGLQVVASATDLTLTLRDAAITGIADGDVYNDPEYSTLHFPHGGTLRAEGTSRATGGAGTTTTAAHAVYAEGPLAVEVGAAALTLTGGASDLVSGQGLFAKASVDITLDGGRFTAEGGAGDRISGAGLTCSQPSTITYGPRGGSVSLLGGIARGRGMRFGYGAQVVGSLTISGAGTLRAEGAIGLRHRGDLDLGAAAVTAVSNAGDGISFVRGGTLRGSGSLTSTGGGGSLRGGGYSGLWSGGDLTLAFTGDLTLRGSSGAVDEINGISYGGDALIVDGALTIEAAPRSIKLIPGVWNGTFVGAPIADYSGFGAVRVFTDNDGAPLFTNNTDIPITADNVNKSGAIIWPKPVDSEWVTVSPASGGDTKANPHTGR